MKYTVDLHLRASTPEMLQRIRRRVGVMALEFLTDGSVRGIAAGCHVGGEVVEHGPDGEAATGWIRVSLTPEPGDGSSGGPG